METSDKSAKRLKTGSSNDLCLATFELPGFGALVDPALPIAPLAFLPPLTLVIRSGFKFHSFETFDKTRSEYSGYLPTLPVPLNPVAQCQPLPEIDYDIGTDDEYALLDAEDCSKEASSSEEDVEEEPRSEDKAFVVDDSYASDTEEDPSFFRPKKPLFDPLVAVRLQVTDFQEDPSRAKEYQIIPLNGLLEDA
jgi:hypothetical protein